MADWQPITTAPTKPEFVHTILIARDHGKRAVMPALFNGEKWLSISVAGLMEFVEPTHWQPFPAPPEQRA